jgi:hypothetical protein
MTDGSDAHNTQWSGWLNKDPNKWMHGQVRRQNSNGHLIYIEELFDRSNTLLSRNWIDCGPDPRTPAYDAPIAAQRPPPRQHPPSPLFCQRRPRWITCQSASSTTKRMSL